MTPSYEQRSAENEEENDVREPHDDRHGVDAEDLPGDGGRRRDWPRATGVGAVLAGTGTRTVVQALGTGVRLIVHGSVTRHWHVYTTKKRVIKVIG